MHRGAPPPAPPPSPLLPRKVKLFGWVSLLNDFASEMIYPLLPAFVTGVLGAGPQALGALDGAAEFAAAFVKLGAGRLADRVPLRGPMIVLGYFIAVVVRPVIAIAGGAGQVIGLRVVDRLGKGLRRPPRDALIADVTPAELRGRAFGLQRGMDHAGAVLGPILAWWLLASGGGSANVRAVIGWSIVPGVVVLALAIWAVRDGAATGGSGRQQAANASEPMPPSAALSRPLPPPLLAISAFYLARMRSEEHTSELQSRLHLVCRLLLEKKKKKSDLQLVCVRAPIHATSIAHRFTTVNWNPKVHNYRHRSLTTH